MNRARQAVEHVLCWSDNCLRFLWLYAMLASDLLLLLLPPQVIVADSYGGSDEPVDTLVAGLLGVDAQVSLVPEMPHS